MHLDVPVLSEFNVCVCNVNSVSLTWFLAEKGLYSSIPSLPVLVTWVTEGSYQTQKPNILHYNTTESLNTQKCLSRLWVVYHNVAQTPELHPAYFIVLWSSAGMENEAETVFISHTKALYRGLQSKNESHTLPSV